MARKIPFGMLNRLMLLVVILAIAARILVSERDSNKTALQWTEHSGSTMGSTYRLVFAEDKSNAASQFSREALLAEFQTILRETEDRVSTWSPTSQLSQFNAQRSTDWFEVDVHTIEMLTIAHALNSLDKRFDVTVAPLSDLWGFGPAKLPPQEPEPAAIDDCLQHVGMSKLEFRRDPPAIRKVDPLLQVDPSALVAGYVADRIARRLSEGGMANYYIDVAGEIIVGGLNREGEKWRVGIAEPEVGSSAVHSVLALTDCAIATSGNYRKFIEVNGERYGHILDPTTGYPAKSDVLSATVISNSCAQADAIATLLMTMNAEAGLALAKEQGWKILLLAKDADGATREIRNDE